MGLAEVAGRIPSSLRKRAVVLKGSRALAADIAVIRWTGFSPVTLQYAIAQAKPYCRTLLLTTTGRRTGERRTVALPWVRHGEGYIVVGSANGGPNDPGWVFNLHAKPECEIRVARRTHPATGFVASGAQRDELFAAALATRPVVADYERLAAGHGRELPIVLLTLMV
jgi:deazaflavin-dependent oxidoreductase (nitroreductase family)